MIDHACSLCAWAPRCELSHAALATSQLASDESTARLDSDSLLKTLLRLTECSRGSDAAPEVIMVLWQNQGGKERNPDEIYSYHLARGNLCVKSELGEPWWTLKTNST